MRSIKTLLFIAGMAASLAACQTDSAGTSSSGADVGKQIQSATLLACSYVPAAATVASIVATFSSAVAPAVPIAAVAQQICDAMTKKSAVRGARPAIKVNGRTVPIEGVFVN